MDGSRISQVDASLIDPGPNDRTVFTQEAIEELASSIERDGLVSPPMVRGTADGRYEIVAGERRVRAMRHLGWATIPVIVREMSDEVAAAIMLAENVHRRDLSPVEEAVAYKSRMDRFGWSVAEVARQAQVGESRVRSRLVLLQLIPAVRDAIGRGDIPLGFGEAMQRLDTNRQLLALRWIAEQPVFPTKSVFLEKISKMENDQWEESNVSLFALMPVTAEMVEGRIAQADGQLASILPGLGEGLPQLPVTTSGIGKVLDAYAAALMDSGRVYEAAVIVDFWKKAMEANYARVSPYESELVRRHPQVVTGPFANVA